jgi:predicted Zn-dependent protease
VAYGTGVETARTDRKSILPEAMEPAQSIRVYKLLIGASFGRVTIDLMSRAVTILFRFTLATALCVVALPLFAAGKHKGVDLYTISQETALGRQMAAEVEKQSHLVDDPIVNEYMNRLGQNLALQAKAEFPITVKMIQSDEINAFTLPGGFVYVNSVIMKMADNEAELASVVAHEIGHAAARHATRQATRGQLARMASLPLGVLLPGWGGVAAGQTAKATAPLVSYHFSREFETEADQLGVGYLSQAGYDPNASIDMFERIASTERRTPGAVSRLFLSHPPTRDRIAKTQAEIRKLKAESPNYILNTSEFEEVRMRLISAR